MADEANAQPDVNQEGAAAPSTEATQETQAQTSTEEHSGAQGTENRIPHARFNEVIEQRNEERKRAEALEARIRELEQGRQGQSTQKQSVVEAEVQRLMNQLGMEEKAARAVVESQANVARAERQAVEQRLRNYEIAEWNRGMAQKYKDYQSVVPHMEKLFSQMSLEEQNLVVSGPRGFEMLYHSAKADLGDAKAKEAFQAGAKAAYENKLKKEALSSTPGSSAAAPKSELSAEAIRNMSIEEYKKRRPEIDAWLARGRQR